MKMEFAGSSCITNVLLTLILALFVTQLDLHEATAQTNDSPRTDWKNWNGLWKPGKAILAGQTLPTTQLHRMRLQLNEGRFDFQLPGFAEKGKLAIVKPAAYDPSVQPGELNVIIEEGPNKGKTVPAIFRFEGQKLVICYASEGKARPAEFGSDVENQNLLVEYVRQD